MEFNEGALNELINQISAGSDNYIREYGKLTTIIEDIQNGTFSGNVAKTFQKVYEENRAIFDTVTRDIEHVSEEVSRGTKEGVQLANELEDTINRGY